VYKLCVQLTGGLGNQMFQYATGRALAINQNIDLALDAWSGFVRDKEYRRNYELSALPIHSAEVGLSQRAALWLYRVATKSSCVTTHLWQPRWYADFYVEREFVFHADLAASTFRRLTWLIGYWQSPKYFENHRTLLQAELMPDPPTSKKFQELGQKMQRCESVALGLRLYEESKNPESHSHLGHIKTANDINSAIKRLTDRRKHLQFFVFCTHRSSILDELVLPANTIFVTADDGYKDSVDCMWLLAQCKHHIFTNSSYYWWGAWLSEAIHKKEEQLIFAADNFINTDGLCDYWQRF
jgi:hypothetical protein